MTAARVFVTVASVSFVLGCSTTVNLTVKNAAPAPLAASVVRTDQNGVRIAVDYELGMVQPGEQATATFEAKPGSSFEVVGSNSVKIASSGSISVPDKPDPYNKSVSLVPSVKVLDPTTSLSDMSRSFKHVGDDIGAKPLRLDNALESVIGAIVVAVKGKDNAPGKSLLTIDPRTFGVKVMAPTDVEPLPTNETSETTTTGSTATTASLQYPMLGQFSAGLSANSVYHLRWNLRGFGTYFKQEDPERSPVAMFSKLSVDHINQIKMALKNNPDARIYYINKFYLLDRAELDIKEAKVASGGGDLESIVINGGTTYSFENSVTNRKSYGPVVLNYWGDEYSLIEIQNPNVHVTTIAGDPMTAPGRTQILVPTGNVASRSELQATSVEDHDGGVPIERDE